MRLDEIVELVVEDEYYKDTSGKDIFPKPPSKVFELMLQKYPDIKAIFSGNSNGEDFSFDRVVSFKDKQGIDLEPYVYKIAPDNPDKPPFLILVDKRNGAILSKDQTQITELPRAKQEVNNIKHTADVGKVFAAPKTTVVPQNKEAPNNGAAAAEALRRQMATKQLIGKNY